MNGQSAAIGHCKVSRLYPEGSREPWKDLEQGTYIFRILGEGEIRERRK